MALPAHDKWMMTRRRWLLAGLGIPLLRGAEEPLSVTFDGDNLHLSAPGLHFLAGKPLERLKDGMTVAYLSKITLFSDNHETILRAPAPERIIVSYDLWQGNFAVAIRGSAVHTSSRLSAQQAEAWCIDNLAVSTLGLAPDRPFWLRFELRSAAQKDFGSLLGDSGISLGTLVEIFSRRPGANDVYYRRDAGPLRLHELPRSFASRGRSG
jgi:hypothetical protein